MGASASGMVQRFAARLRSSDRPRQRGPERGTVPSPRESAIGLGRNTQPDTSAVRSSSASPATDAARYTVAGSSPSSRSDLAMKWM